jgi:excinuclease ABC subunit B
MPTASPAPCSAPWTRLSAAATKQIAHNEEHGITPRTIVRGVSDVLEGVMEKTAKGRGRARSQKRADGVAEDQAKFEPNNLKAAIADLEKRMREAAANLEFEEAARLRDEVKRLERETAGG